MACAPRQNHRVGDMADPLWNLLDMTPDGRGETWFLEVGSIRGVSFALGGVGDEIMLRN